MTVFDDNATDLEGIENLTAVLNLSEYTLSLGVRLNQNSSTAIIYIEDNSESVSSHHWYATLLLLGIPVCTGCACLVLYVYEFSYKYYTWEGGGCIVSPSSPSSLSS